jgi:hypothetical protein
LLGTPRSQRPTPESLPSAAQEASPVDSPPTPPAQDVAAPRTKPKAKPRRAADDDENKKQAVPVYLPGPLFSQVKAAAGQAGMTYTDWLLDVYERVHSQLDTVFTRPAPRQSGLPPRKPQRRRVDTPTPVQLRLTGVELAVLEARREEVGGPSRSEFWTKIAQLGLEAS